MTTALAPFTYAGLPIRTVVADGEPWFVAAEVCAALGISNYRDAIGRLDADEKGVGSADTLGGPQQVTLISEPGIYHLAATSRRPEAKPFVRWFTHDVIPAIRKTGSYSVAEPETREQFLARAVLEATAAIAEKDQQIAELAPKAEAFADLMDANGLYTMEATAKALGWGRNVLFRDLRRMGILQGNNLPYQRHMHHFDVKVATYVNRKTGETCPTATTYVRPAGLDWLRRRLLQSPTLIGADS